MSRAPASAPIRGIPGRLPPGETLLWQGAPDFATMALRVFHARKVAIYFGALASWRAGSVLREGASTGAAALAAAPLLGLGVAAVIILGVIAALVCRTTIYTITSRRVFMRIGVALPIIFNLPFAALCSGGLKHVGRAGVGTIALTPDGADRIAYLVLWPHARPGRFRPAEPALRFVPDAARVARLLAEAVAAARPGAVAAAEPAALADRVPEPHRGALAPAAA